MAAEAIRLGVDIGGTFTDVVLEVGKSSHSTKVLTTYAAPENAIIDGMHQVCAKAGIGAEILGWVVFRCPAAARNVPQSTTETKASSCLRLIRLFIMRPKGYRNS